MPPSPSTTGPDRDHSFPGLVPESDADRRLVERVHPPDWRNPAPADAYNLVVLGGGTAGLVCAAGAAGLGARVALVERRLLGGDCLNYGCVPSKAVLVAARAVADARAARAAGLMTGDEPGADFTAAMSRMRRLRAEIAAHDSAARFRDLGVDVFIGDARFADTRSVEVNGARLRFARAVVATGSRPSVPPVPGLEAAGYLTSETVFGLTTLPRRLVVLGAGPIGCELAQAFARFGSAVTMVSLDAEILPGDDPDASRIVQARLVADGVVMVLGARATAVTTTAGGRRLHFDRGRGDESVEGDVLLVATGRDPNIEGLGLEAAGVAVGPSGVTVDDRLRTTNRRVYAAGDVCSRQRFTHAADAMARVVIQNALFFGRRSASALVIPRCTYTDPELAHIGWRASEAEAAGHRVRTIEVPMRGVDRAVLDGDTDGFARLHVTARGRILGGTIVARHAGEMIGTLSVAMAAGLGAPTLSNAILPYPTQAEALRKLGDTYRRSMLTPRLRALLTRVLAWRR